jgi:prolyl oligopeptidase
MRRALALALLAAVLSLPAVAQQSQSDSLRYPTTRKDTIVDTYFGTMVPAPYQWLEDQNSPEVAQWVDAENAVTFRYLDGLPIRGWIKNRLTELWNYGKVGVPERVAGRLYYSKNSGLQNQSVVYVQDSVGAPAVELIDPNTRWPDGAVDLAGYQTSPNGQYLAYMLAPGGADWREIHVHDLIRDRELADTVRWVKFSGTAWTRDGKGFFYGRFPTPTEGQELSATSTNQKIYYHVVGTPQEQDQLIYERPDLPDWFMGAGVSDDGRYLFIVLSRGWTANRLYYADLENGMRPNLSAEVRPLFDQNDAEYVPLGEVHDTLYLQTTKDAPKRRIASVVLGGAAEPELHTVVPEGDNVIEEATLAGGRIVVRTLEDVKSRVRFYAPDGKALGELPLPGIGTVAGLSGHYGITELFYAYTSFLYPTTVFRYDFVDGSNTAFQAPRVPFDPSAYETKQVFYTSQDGTKVPMFVTAKKGMKLDGSNPTVLYAYGGFNISVTPSFSVTVPMWLELGGVYAVANLRGGGEYGDAWHRAGMGEHKQNVFDDYLAAAEYLINQKYTSPAKLAIQGYSNGGLLVGAAMTQRPGLFAVAYPGAGVMDMLRYQKFTAGVGWVPEYGSSDDSTAFQYLYKYSPLHNLKPGTCYPATIVTTADHDDRVVPAHSYKFVARLQAVQSCNRPVLIRVETQTSHGYMPTDKRIAQTADVWAFTAANLGVTSAQGASR